MQCPNSPHSSSLGSRAELIRNLSVFISNLALVVRPGDGNQQTCKEAELRLIRILDQVLDPRPTVTHATSAASPQQQQEGAWFGPPIPGVDGLDHAGTGLEDFLNWFDSGDLRWDFGGDTFA